MEGGGGSSSSSRLMAFGENNNLYCPVVMMPPNMVCSHPSCNNTPFLHTPAFAHDQDLNLHGDGGRSSMMLEEHHKSGNNDTSNGCYSVDSGNDTGGSSVRAKIMAHPYYHRLLAAYVNCQKIGAPPEVVARLEEAVASSAAMGPQRTSSVGEDPALDQFMEAYCAMLIKYEQELSKPFKEAMLSLSRIERQFKALTLSNSDSACGKALETNASSADQVDVNNIRPGDQEEDQELKIELLRKYGEYLGNLKQEMMKKRKKKKLPKQARRQLLEWWDRHYKWPYPSEAQKMALAELTGLDQKQINYWFINQRKRHWKPSDGLQFVVMEPHYYMDDVLVNPFATDISQGFL